MLAPDSPGESSYNVPAVMWAGETSPLLTIRTDDGADAEWWAIAHSREHLQRWRDRNEGLTQQWLEDRGQEWDPTETSCVNAESVIDGVTQLLTHPDLAAIADAGTVGVLTVDLDEESLVRGHPELSVTSFTGTDPHDHEPVAVMAPALEIAPEPTDLEVSQPSGGTPPPPPSHFNETQMPEQDWGTPPPPPPGYQHWQTRDSQEPTQLWQELNSAGVARARFNLVVNRLRRASGRPPTHTTTHPEPAPPPSTPTLT